MEPHGNGLLNGGSFLLVQYSVIIFVKGEEDYMSTTVEAYTSLEAGEIAKEEFQLSAGRIQSMIVSELDGE